MIDLSPMSHEGVDPLRRKAWVGGDSLLCNLDRSAQHHGLATTATSEKRPVVCVGYVGRRHGRGTCPPLDHSRGRGAFSRARAGDFLRRPPRHGDPNGPCRRRYSKGHYLTELGDDAIDAYTAAKLARLADLKRRYDPDNAFDLNQNIRPLTRLANPRG